MKTENHAPRGSRAGSKPEPADAEYEYTWW